MNVMERKDVGDRQLDALLERLDRLCDEVHTLNRRLDSGEHLLRISRELSYLDAQGGRPHGFAGTRLDRNVTLYVR